MENHIVQNNILRNDQYGFRQQRSTLLQLLKVNFDCEELLNNKPTCDLIYFDFRKAFDSVDHKMKNLKN